MEYNFFIGPHRKPLVTEQWFPRPSLWELLFCLGPVTFSVLGTSAKWSPEVVPRLCLAPSISHEAFQGQPRRSAVWNFLPVGARIPQHCPLQHGPPRVTHVSPACRPVLLYPFVLVRRAARSRAQEVCRASACLLGVTLSRAAGQVFIDLCLTF